MFPTGTQRTAGFYHPLEGLVALCLAMMVKEKKQTPKMENSKHVAKSSESWERRETAKKSALWHQWPPLLKGQARMPHGAVLRATVQQNRDNVDLLRGQPDQSGIALRVNKLEQGISLFDFMGLKLAADCSGLDGRIKAVTALAADLPNTIAARGQ